MINISIKLDTSKLDGISAGLEQRAEGILQRGATEIQGAAIQNTTRIDTGAMKSGWRVLQQKRLQRTIFNVQEYAIYHEMGTVRMSATPMLVPAVEQYRRKINDAWKALFDV